MRIASSPLIRTIPIAPSPGAVEIAAMVSNSVCILSLTSVSLHKKSAHSTPSISRVARTLTANRYSQRDYTLFSLEFIGRKIDWINSQRFLFSL